MLEVNFYEKVDDTLLDFAVIIAKFHNKWIFCKHKERNTFELPGGHREKGESILDTACRELKEETGAINFQIKPIFTYSVTGKTKVNKREEDTSYGMVFVAQVFTFESIHSEMEKIIICDDLITNWTYPLIQPQIIQEAIHAGYL